MIVPSPAVAAGATQFSGVAYWHTEGQCADPEAEGASYAVYMSGDLEGCLYSFAETSVMSPIGAYNEIGTEIFVGVYNGESGTFETMYRFAAKYTNNTDFVEVEGRCQHPIVAGCGTGVFEGMTGLQGKYSLFQQW